MMIILPPIDVWYLGFVWHLVLGIFRHDYKQKRQWISK